MNNIIEVSNLSKKYEMKYVLQDVSILVGEGEIFGLIGPSGVGKTTLINILTGQSKRTGGIAKILGVDCENLPEDIYSRIGMVLDTTALFERLSCYQNLSIYADIFHVDKKRVSEVLEQVGLLGEEKTAAFKMSKGMRQRLILARAILNNPKILFLDEPTSALDPSNTLSVHEMIKSLQKQGTTVFLTTHRMDEVMKLCDKVALLYGGSILEYGNPVEICNRHDLEKNIHITLTDGKTITLPNNEEAEKILASYTVKGLLKSVHSSEPDLETVFLSLTERRK